VEGKRVLVTIVNVYILYDIHKKSVEGVEKEKGI